MRDMISGGFSSGGCGLAPVCGVCILCMSIHPT